MNFFEKLGFVKKTGKIKVKLDKSKGAILPTRAHAADAGLDLYTPVDIEVPIAVGTTRTFDGRPVHDYTDHSATIDTGVGFEIPFGYVGFIKSKSGIMCKSNVIAGEGVIDSGYTGSVVVKLYNMGVKPKIFKAGDKIAQIVFLPCGLFEPEEVFELSETERGENGFGSTGR